MVKTYSKETSVYLLILNELFEHVCIGNVIRNCPNQEFLLGFVITVCI